MIDNLRNKQPSSNSEAACYRSKRSLQLPVNTQSFARCCKILDAG